MAGCMPSIRKPASSAWRRHQHEVQCQRHGHRHAQLHLHQLRAYARRRRVVGRHDRRAARRVPGLAGRPLDARPRQTARPRIPTRALPRPPRSAPPSTPTGKRPTACPSAPSFSAAAARTPFRWYTRPSTGPPACIPAPPWDRKPPPRPPEPPGTCAAIPWPCCPSAATIWATISAHWITLSARSTIHPASSTSTGSARTQRRKVSVAGVWREYARAQVGLRTLQWHGQGRGYADRSLAAARLILISAVCDISASQSGQAAERGRGWMASGSSADPRALYALRIAPAAGPARRSRSLGAAAQGGEEVSMKGGAAVSTALTTQIVILSAARTSVASEGKRRTCLAKSAKGTILPAAEKLFAVRFVRARLQSCRYALPIATGFSP